MIYQFEHEEIKDCYGCPLLDGEYGNCNITGKDGVDGSIPADCPLVAISKTETASCKWCEIASVCEYEVTFFRDGDRWATERSLMPKFCPNCGRQLEKQYES